MKKALVLAGLCLVLSPAAFAFDLSFGGGFLFNANLGFWHLNNRKAAQNTTFNYGLFGFFDAYYALAEVSFFGWSETIDQKDRENQNANGLGVGFAAYLKWPFSLSPVLRIFPLAGAEYQFGLTGQNYKLHDTKKEETRGFFMDTLWAKAGLGLDIAPADPLYLRGILLWGYKVIPTAYELANPKLNILHHGPSLRFAIGFRL